MIRRMLDPLIRRPVTRSVIGDSLIRNSVLVMTTTAFNSAVGYLYWMAAARLFVDDEVGRATAVIAAMNLTALVANLGLGTALVANLPSRRDDESWSRNVVATFAVAAASGIALGTVVAVGLPRVLDSLGPVFTWPVRGLFVVGVTLSVVSVVLDALFIAERRADGLLARNASFTFLKLVLLVPAVVFTINGERFLVLTWVTGLVVALGWVVVLLVPRILRPVHLRPAGVRREARSVVPGALGHHLANLGGQFPMFLLPLIVIHRSSDAASAYFYVTWMVGSIFFMVSNASSNSLFAEGAHEPGALGRQLRRCLRLVGLILVPAMLGAVVLGRLVLGLFGANYARFGHALLLLLVVSAVPDAITNIWVSRWRVMGWVGRVAVLNVLMAVVALTVAWELVPRTGIEGAGWAWIVAQSSGCVFIAGVEGVHRLARSRRSRSRVARSRIVTGRGGGPDAPAGARPDVGRQATVEVATCGS